MSKFAFIPGIILTAVLICLLALSRIDTSEKRDMRVYDVDVVELPTPPPPELSEPEQEQQPEDVPLAPTPEIELPDVITDLDRPEITLSPLTVSIETPVDIFRETAAVADLPPPPKPVKKSRMSIYNPPKKTSKVSPKPLKYSNTQKKTIPAAPKAPTKKTPTKSQYSIGELDSAPQVTRKGRFSWPRSGKGTEGKVVMRLKITKSGKVEVISITSSTNPSLNDSAMKVARGTRFTPPRKHGQAVEAVYTKTFYLKKP